MYGEQLLIEFYELKTPEDEVAMERYLGSGAIKGIGSALADLLGGFPIWIVPTLIIKSVMAYLLSKIAYDAEGNCRVFSVRTLIGVLVCMAWMVFGYTAAGAVLYGGLAAGLSSTPGLAAKAVVNTVIAYAAGGVLEKAGFRRILARQA